MTIENLPPSEKGWQEFKARLDLSADAPCYDMIRFAYISGWAFGFVYADEKDSQ